MIAHTLRSELHRLNETTWNQVQLHNFDVDLHGISFSMKKVAVLAFTHRSGYHCYYFEYYFSVVDFVYNNNCVYCDSYIFHYCTVCILLFYLETVPPRVQPQKL